MEEMEEAEKTKKRLIYKAKNRGCKESEFVLSALCQLINSESEREALALIDKFLSEADNDIFNWFFDLPKNKNEYEHLITRIKELMKSSSTS
jgi:succinate dehydrogenase flavin-adding protein (antitoxin of CptAB toxin-antitoxin module)